MLYVILASMIGAAFFIGAYGVILAHKKANDNSPTADEAQEFYASHNWKN